MISHHPLGTLGLATFILNALAFRMFTKQYFIVNRDLQLCRQKLRLIEKFRVGSRRSRGLEKGDQLDG